MKILINTFDKLVEVIETQGLTTEQRNELVRLSLKLIVLDDYNKTDLIRELRAYWSKYKDAQERPIFLNLDLEVKE